MTHGPNGFSIRLMLRQITWGFVVGYVGLCALASCGAPSLLQCRAEAVTALPLEPDAITLGDVKEVARRVKACQAQGDAGP
ncbi:MAG: hypothetical protein A2V88_15360 [Elusimicrobia bacterium RBG_16_66_12]|nr:MAG: hypothetical protein A2V88_15360 [Elusimicrobia bacterium RBG_16_66_12]